MFCHLFWYRNPNRGIARIGTCLSCIHTHIILGYKVTEQGCFLDSNPLPSMGSTAFFFPSGSGPVEHRTTARRCSSKENSSVSLNLFFKMSFQNSQITSNPDYCVPQSKELNETQSILTIEPEINKSIFSPKKPFVFSHVSVNEFLAPNTSLYLKKNEVLRFNETALYFL